MFCVQSKPVGLFFSFSVQLVIHQKSTFKFPQEKAVKVTFKWVSTELYALIFTLLYLLVELAFLPILTNHSYYIVNSRMNSVKTLKSEFLNFCFINRGKSQLLNLLEEIAEQGTFERVWPTLCTSAFLYFWLLWIFLCTNIPSEILE